MDNKRLQHIPCPDCGDVLNYKRWDSYYDQIVCTNPNCDYSIFVQTYTCGNEMKYTREYRELINSQRKDKEPKIDDNKVQETNIKKALEKKFNSLEEYLERKRHTLIKKYDMKLPCTIWGLGKYNTVKNESGKLFAATDMKEFKLSFLSPEEELEFPFYILNRVSFSNTWSVISLPLSGGENPRTLEALSDFLNNLEHFYEEKLKNVEKNKIKEEEEKIEREKVLNRFLSTLE